MNNAPTSPLALGPAERSPAQAALRRSSIELGSALYLLAAKGHGLVDGLKAVHAGITQGRRGVDILDAAHKRLLAGAPGVENPASMAANLDALADLAELRSTGASIALASLTGTYRHIAKRLNSGEYDHLKPATFRFLRNQVDDARQAVGELSDRL